MNEITRRLRKKAIQTSRPLVAQLVAEGLEKNMIVQAVKRFTESKMNQFYHKQAELPRMGRSLDALINDVKAADSKAEVIFYNMLCDNDISFQFQYVIGPYCADYLVGESLVVELDGPQHDKAKDARRDKYLRSMGYEVLRIPLWTVAMDHESVIAEIKPAM